jgi:hypothetical protein
MLKPEDYADVQVTVNHPWGDIEVPLTEWIAKGPGPRAYLGINAARRKSTGEPVPLDQIPEEYHNTAESRRKQRSGQLPTPWGPPPPEPDF